jgi:hypothetical protein
MHLLLYQLRCTCEYNQSLRLVHLFPEYGQINL